MEIDRVDACLRFIGEEWRGRSDGCRPASVWIAQHDALASNFEALDAAIVAVWHLDSRKLQRRMPSSYARFRVVQSGKHWHSGIGPTPRSELFADGVHEIGLAAFAPIFGSDRIYLETMWGGTFGKGAFYRFDRECGRLVALENLWLS